MNATLNQLSSRELEIELLKRAITRTHEEIQRQTSALEVLRFKQFGRIRELAVQETLLQIRNRKS